MELWPAIDLMDGRFVRLAKGDFATSTDFGDPLVAARAMVVAGAQRLHVVDLDAARTGDPLNRATVLELAKTLDVPLQVGGGIRDRRTVEDLLEAGVARVVVGTLSIEDPDLVRSLAEEHPGQILIGLDYERVPAALSSKRPDPREGTSLDDTAEAVSIAVRGWVKHTGQTFEEVMSRYLEAPIAGTVVTDISRDGVLSGPDLKGLSELLDWCPFPVVASGGVRSTADLSALSALDAGGQRLSGAIVGRALAEGHMTMAEAVAACKR